MSIGRRAGAATSAWRDEIEQVLDAVRIGRTAGACEVPDEGRWMVPTWPVAVTTPGEGSGASYWTTRWSIEPGSPVRADRPVEVVWSAKVQGRDVEGSWWLIPEGHGPVDAARYPTRVATTDGGDLPAGLTYPCTRVETTLDPAQARGALRWLARKGKRAWDHDLPPLIEPLVRRTVRREVALGRIGGGRRSTLGRDDVAQDAREIVYGAATRYASPQRPEASWSAVVYRALGRDLPRRRRDHDLEAREIVELRGVIARAVQEGTLGDAPTACEVETLVEGHRHKGRPRWSRSQVEHALRPEAMIGSIDAPARAGEGDAPLIETLTEDPGDALAALEADDHLGEVLDATGLDASTILPLLVEAGIVEGDAPSRAELTAARRSFAAAWAAPGEFLRIPADRARMEERARQVMEQVLAGSASWDEVASTLLRWRSTRYSA